MKLFIRIFLETAIFVGVWWSVWGFFLGFEEDISSAVWSGMVGGVVVGFAAAVVARYQQNRVLDSPPVLTDEVLLRRGRASYNGIVGWLYLTNRRVFFEGYPTDETAPEISTLFDDYPRSVTTHEISIPVHEISEAGISRPLGVRRLDIFLSNGRTESFITEDLADWVDDISTVRRNYLEEPRSENMRLFQ